MDVERDDPYCKQVELNHDRLPSQPPDVRPLHEQRALLLSDPINSSDHTHLNKPETPREPILNPVDTYFSNARPQLYPLHWQTIQNAKCRFPRPRSPIVRQRGSYRHSTELRLQTHTTPQPEITYSHDRSHEGCTTTGGAGVCYRDWLPAGGGRLVKLAYYLNPIHCSLDAETNTYMLAVQRTAILLKRHAAFFKGQNFTVRHCFDSKQLMRWLTEEVRIKVDNALYCLLYRLTRCAIAITYFFSKLPRTLKLTWTSAYTGVPGLWPQLYSSTSSQTD